MIPQEVLKKIKYIEITARRAVDQGLAGEYHSVFKGRGMEFEEIRQYYPGDDIRTIDWNVTARMGTPFVKRYREERELTVMLMVDASGSGEFGTAGALKGEIIAEISALLALSAVRNNDRVGLIIFTDRIERFIPPMKGRRHVLRVIREILYYRPESRGTDLGVALEHLLRVLRRHGVVFLISDFLDPRLISDTAETQDRSITSLFRTANRKHDLTLIKVADPREHELPPAGILHLQDLETGEAMVVDSMDAEFRRQFRSRRESQEREFSRLAASNKVDLVRIETNKPYIDPLMKLFRERAKRR